MRGIHGGIIWRIFGAFVDGVFGLPVTLGLVWVGLVAVCQLGVRGVVADSWDSLPHRLWGGGRFRGWRRLFPGDSMCWRGRRDSVLLYLVIDRGGRHGYFCVIM